QGPQQPPHRTAILPAVRRLDDAGQPVNAQYAAGQALAGIDRGPVRLAARFSQRSLGDDGAAARQLALGAHALPAGGRLLGVAVVVEAARPLLGPRRLGAVLPQIDADLF